MKPFFFSPSNYKLWIIVALLFKGIIFLHKLSAPAGSFLDIPIWGNVSADSQGYIAPVDNFLKSGEYYDDYRMPGYGIIYFFFKLFAKKATALNIMLVLQWMIASVSVYALGLTALKLFDEKRLFYLCFGIYLFLPHASIWDSYILTESFSASFFIFSFYFLITATDSPKRYFLAGLFITWCVFLKPVFAPFLLLYGLHLFLQHYKNSRVLVKAFSFYLIVFLLAEGTWVYRNYIKYDRFIPLTKSVYHTPPFVEYWLSSWQFFQAIGVDMINWEPRLSLTKNIPDNIPEGIYTSQFNRDSLIALKRLVEVEKNLTDTAKREKYALIIDKKLKLYTFSFKNERPLQYYIVAPWRLLKIYIFKRSDFFFWNDFSKKMSFLEGVSVLFLMVYSFRAVIILCLLSIPFIIKKHYGSSSHWVLLTAATYFIFLFPVVLRLVETRYIIPGLGFIVICASYMLLLIYKKLIALYKKNYA